MKNNKKLTVVVLAAGLGTRLGALTKDRPKALTRVNGRPIISYALSWARLLNPKKIVIVGGYLFPQLEMAVRALDPNAVVVENKDFSITQRMASLLVARNEIEGDLAVFDGDYIYHRSIAEKIKPHLQGSMKIFCTSEEHPQVHLDMMVHTDENNWLIDMSKYITKYEYYFNSFFYCPDSLVDAYFNYAEQTMRRLGVSKTHLEDAIVECAKNGLVVRVVSIGYPRWIEIDTPQDIAIARMMVGADGAGFKIFKNHVHKK